MRKPGFYYTLRAGLDGICPSSLNQVIARCSSGYEAAGRPARYKVEALFARAKREIN
jgi:hypothetical protein